MPTLYDHPVYKRDYILPTPPIAEAIAKTNEVVLAGDPGISYHGESRCGKTRFTRYLPGKIIDHARREVPVFRVVATHNQKPSELRCYEEIYQDLFGTSKRLSRASDYLAGLRSLFVCEARAARCQDVVLVVDQAGRWPWENIRWLSDLQNKISDVDVNLVYVLVGHRLTRLRNDLIANDHKDVVARYLNPVYEFRSLKGTREIAKVLQFYDTGTAYPSGSDTSYTEHFLPGTQLVPHSKNLWTAFQQHTRQIAGKTPKAWPMAFFTKTIERLLINCGNDVRFKEIADEHIERAIAEARYADLFALRTSG